MSGKHPAGFKIRRKTAEQLVNRRGIIVRVDLLECGHQVRHWEPRSTRDRIKALSGIYRRCFECGKLKPETTQET